MSTTTVVTVSPDAPDAASVRRVATLLRDGRLVAFPTETVYGLGANALDADAVARIFAAKGRPADNPLIVHVASADHVARVAREVPERARALFAHFCPGPLTVVLPRAPALPDAVTAGLDSVAVRVPSHPVALALLRAADVPVAAPSANRSGRPSPTTAAHVLADLDGRIDAILDGGPTSVGVESTVVDVRGFRPVVLRLGAVTTAMLETVLGPVEVHPAASGTPPGLASLEAARSPGMRHRHYAPEAAVRLFEGPDRVAAIVEAWRKSCRDGHPSVAILTDESAAQAASLGLPAGAVLRAGPRGRPEVYAQRLYALLREADARASTLVLAEGPDDAGVGAAVLDRLRRAAAR